MKCPMTFGGDLRSIPGNECREDCAWIVRVADLECCAVALMACETMKDNPAWMPKNKTIKEDECR